MIKRHKERQKKKDEKRKQHNKQRMPINVLEVKQWKKESTK